MDTVSNLVQVAFWVVVGTIAVLTFKQARRTVLQPLRTEVFKLQLELMREVLALFVGRDETRLKEDAHIWTLYHANIWRLLDGYGETFFPIRIDKSNRPYSNITTFRATEETLIEFSTLSTAHTTPPRKEPTPEERQEELQKQWPGLLVLETALPPGLIEYENKIRLILEDPLLPTDCAKLLEEYLDAIHDFIASIEPLLKWAAPQLATLYPTLDDLKIATDSWLSNHWNRQTGELKPHADRITAFAREYFKSDEFAPRPKNNAKPSAPRIQRPVR